MLGYDLYSNLGVEQNYQNTPYIYGGEDYKMKYKHGFLKVKNKETKESKYLSPSVAGILAPVYRAPVELNYTPSRWNSVLIGREQFPRGTTVQNPRTGHFVHASSEEGKEIKLYFFLKRNLRPGRNFYTEGKGKNEVYVFGGRGFEYEISVKEAKSILKKYDH